MKCRFEPILVLSALQGIVLASRPGGAGIYVESLVPKGNADKSGLVKVCVPPLTAFCTGRHTACRRSDKVAEAAAETLTAAHDPGLQKDDFLVTVGGTDGKTKDVSDATFEEAMDVIANIEARRPFFYFTMISPGRLSCAYSH